MPRRRDPWQMWLRHHGLAIAYRHEAAAATADGAPQQTIALLTWEAQRHQHAANKRRNQIRTPRKANAA